MFKGFETFYKRKEAESKEKKVRFINWMPSLRFSMKLPLIRIETVAFFRHDHLIVKEIVGLNIDIWRYHFYFDIYARPSDY